ncbi:MAG: hypothetical protein Q9170_007269, partial [Blastenia crenularia]
VRCHMGDAKLAVETGVDGLDLVIGTSELLREHSHGKDMSQIVASAIVRFSSEDSFRSDLVDLLSPYKAVDAIGVDRVGIADKVGCAQPRQSKLMHIQSHNHTGCALANSFVALEAVATHVDTSVLGIGERNGITPLGGLMARMIVSDHEYVTGKHKIRKLKEIEDYVTAAVQV